MKHATKNLNASGKRDGQDKDEDENEKPTHRQDCQAPTGPETSIFCDQLLRRRKILVKEQN